MRIAFIGLGEAAGAFITGWGADRAGDIWEALFPTIMMGDDRAIGATYVAGTLKAGRMAAA